MPNTTPIDPNGFARIADGLSLGKDPASVRRRIEAMEQLLEGMITVPGTNRRIGLDFIVGLVPVVGDLVTTAMGGWLVWEARNLGMTKLQISRMMGNVGVDFMVGLIPFVGDAVDFFFRSNTRNLRIIKRHLDRHHPSSATIDNRA